MRRWLTPLALTVCALLTASQGVALALHRSIVLDEAVTLMHSAAVAHGKWSELFDDIHMPAYNILVAGWTSLFGLDAFVAKTFSVVCALAAGGDAL